jgi:putative solute:sodium symporter small subunit
MSAVTPDCRIRAYLVNKRMPTPRPGPDTKSNATNATNANPSLPEPPPVTAATTRAHRAYWRFNLALIAVLMLLGFGVSFGLPLLATRLETVRFAGFPLPFYFGAQGAIIVYVALTLIYIVLMQLADARLQRALEAC